MSENMLFNIFQISWHQLFRISTTIPCSKLNSWVGSLFLDGLFIEGLSSIGLN